MNFVREQTKTHGRDGGKSLGDGWGCRAPMPVRGSDLGHGQGRLDPEPLNLAGQSAVPSFCFTDTRGVLRSRGPGAVFLPAVSGHICSIHRGEKRAFQGLAHVPPSHTFQALSRLPVANDATQPREAEYAVPYFRASGVSDDC
jgi:hypothetical protein